QNILFKNTNSRSDLHKFFIAVVEKLSPRKIDADLFLNLTESFMRSKSLMEFCKLVASCESESRLHWLGTSLAYCEKDDYELFNHYLKIRKDYISSFDGLKKELIILRALPNHDAVSKI
ncbi:MAG: hypothetical protein ACFFD4_37650, partial [Candidatus Odinarchaeota archaeon]